MISIYIKMVQVFFKNDTSNDKVEFLEKMKKYECYKLFGVVHKSLCCGIIYGKDYTHYSHCRYNVM